MFYFITLAQERYPFSPVYLLYVCVKSYWDRRFQQNQSDCQWGNEYMDDLFSILLLFVFNV